MLGKEILVPVAELLKTLNVLDTNVASFGNKVADYVFFPLAYVFQESNQLPARAIEISLQCLQILISKGWQATMGWDMYKQLLILLNFLIGGGTAEIDTSTVDEGISSAAFGCLQGLLLMLHTSFSNLSQTQYDQGLPVIGHTLTVVLNGVTDGPSKQIQLEAVNALGAFTTYAPSDDLLRKFLPGIISTLNRVIRPSAASRRSQKVLLGCLGVMKTLIQKTMGDRQEAHFDHDQDLLETSDESSRLAWVKATSAQLKVALANVAKLRYDEQEEVQDGLFDLCIMILGDCSKSLQDSLALIMETTIVLCSQNNDSTSGPRLDTTRYIIMQNSDLEENLQASMHDWITALPRVMQSRNDQAKERNLRKLTSCVQIMKSLHIEFKTFATPFVTSIQESTVSFVTERNPTIMNMVDDNGALDLILHGSGNNAISAVSTSTPSVLARTEAGISPIEALIHELNTSDLSKVFHQKVLLGLTLGSGTEILANLWLAYWILSSQTNDLEDFTARVTNLVDTMDHDSEFSEETYDYSVAFLTTTNVNQEKDWKLQALALEILSLRSKRLQEEFRVELVDALYPVVERLGSGNHALRQAAISCLNVFSDSCGYSSSSDLIIQNADYLVNSVGLRFNTFDITPQTAQMLVMMVEFCGPALIPYLDDILESIFSTLANYHGYPRLVESLFSVLAAIVEKSGSQTITRIEANAMQQRPGSCPLSISDLSATLKQLNLEESSRETRDSALNLQPDPKDDKDADSEDQSNQIPEPPESTPTPEKREKTKTYTMIHSISKLGQHYLTHESPILRRQILQLTALECRILSTDEDEFLPLVNDIWPVVIKRLYDTEPYVTIAAAETICEILRCAGDFMMSRIEDEWRHIRALCTRTQTQLQAGGKLGNSKQSGLSEVRRNTPNSYSSPHQIWTALVKLLLTIIQTFPHISTAMETDLFDMLEPYISVREDIRDGLNSLNADAVWLRLQMEAASVETPPVVRKTPRSRLGGFEFVGVGV